MATMTKTFGYSRSHAVPNLPGTQTKLCRYCDLWFAARPYERRCDGCTRPKDRSKRVLGDRTRVAQSPSKRPGRQAAKRGSKGRELCMEMAWELAAVIDKTSKSTRPQSMTKRDAYRYTKWNVDHGLQGRCDLERYR